MLPVSLNDLTALSLAPLRRRRKEKRLRLIIHPDNDEQLLENDHRTVSAWYTRKSEKAKFFTLLEMVVAEGLEPPTSRM